MSNMTNYPQQSFNFINEIGSNPIVIIVFAVIIGAYYLIFALLGNKSSDNNSDGGGSVVFVEALLWGVFIVLVLLNGMSYFFNIDIVASIKNIFSDTPEILVKVNNKVGDIGKKTSSKNPSNDTTIGDSSNKETTSNNVETNDTTSTSNFLQNIKSQRLLNLPGKEVFNIRGNNYTYLDAQALCKAYDSELATYDQIYDAYKKGAEWCNYGWSADQMVFFPTQKSTWNNLQKLKGHENDCGRIGINGGYIENPNARFGVNCFGTKPSITNEESKLMQRQKLAPQSIDELEIDKRMQQFKNSNLNNILISPFNKNTWSKI